MPKYDIAERDYSLEELLGEVVDEEAEQVMQQVAADMFAIQFEAIAAHNHGTQAETEQVPKNQTLQLATLRHVF